MTARPVPIPRTNNPVLPNRLNSPLSRPSVVAFQYTGTTALTAIGPLSGRQYRFTHPGAVVQVDPRDRASLAAVPNLQQV